MFRKSAQVVKLLCGDRAIMHLLPYSTRAQVPVFIDPLWQTPLARQTSTPLCRNQAEHSLMDRTSSPLEREFHRVDGAPGSPTKFTPNTT